LIDGLPTGLTDLGSDYEARLASQKGDARAAVSVLADALDCDVSISGRVYFLTYRYRTGNTLPGITLPECAAFLRDMRSILSPFRASRNRDTAVAESERHYGDAIVRSFSESQWQMMKDEGLPIAKLGPEQERMVSNFSAFFYIDDYLRDITRIQKRSGEISSPDAFFTSRQMRGRRVYGIDFASGSRRLFLPLTAPGSFRLDSDGGLYSGQLVTDPSSDLLVDNALPVTSETIADVIGRANQRLLQSGPASPGETAMSVTVDDALGEKPLEVFGAEGMDPAALAESVSRLYNLRVTRVTGEKLLLTRRARIGARDIGSLAPAIRQATPSPLVRYVEGRLLQQAERDAKMSRDYGIKEKLPDFPLSTFGVGKLPDDLRRNAAEVLSAYAATLDKDNALATKPVPVSHLSAQARSAIANFVMAEMMTELPRYFLGPPAYISNLKNGTVRAEIQESDGKKRYRLTVEAPFPGNTTTTTRKSLIQISGVEYPRSSK
jgi:hypothetical protein